MKAKFIFLLVCLIQMPVVVTAEDGKVLSAGEIKKSQGKFCTSKSFVDIHAHAACLDDGGKNCFISERMKTATVALGLINKYESMFDAFGVSKADLEEKGGAFFFEHVSKLVDSTSCVEFVVLLALDGTYRFNDEKFDQKNTDFMIRNDFVFENVKKYPNLLWGASVHPLRKDFREELEKAYRNGAVLIKLIPPIQAVPLASDAVEVIERLKEYFALLAKYKLPLLIHLDEQGTFSKELEKKFREYVGLSGIEAALKSGVTVIVAHAASRDSQDTHAKSGGSLGTYHELLTLMGKSEYRGKLYTDISALPTIITRDDDLCNVVKDYRGKEDRLLWGSDYPLNHWKTTSTLLVGVDCNRSYFGMTSAEGYVFSRERNQWDRGVFLQKNMGVSDTIFNNTKHFLIERNLVNSDTAGKIHLQTR